MTQENIKSIVSEVMESIMPTMAEAIAKSLAKYVTTDTTVEGTVTIPTQVVDATDPKVVEIINEELACRKAIIGEYSDKSWYFVGSIREDGEKIKGIKGCYRFGELRSYGDGSTKGWTFSRKQITQEQLAEALRSMAYEVAYGDSCIEKFNENKAKDEANKTPAPAPASTPAPAPTPKPTKVVAMEKKADMNVKSFVGTVYNGTKDNKTVKIENVNLTQIPTLHSAYYYTVGESEYVAIFAAGLIWIGLGKAKVLNGKILSSGGTLENHDTIAKITDKGVAVAVQNKVLPKVHQYMVDAYKEGGATDVATWLEKHAA